MIAGSSVYRGVPLNTSEVPQSELNIENKFRSNPLTWSGQFSPQLIQVLLKTYAKRNTTLLDPFVGSGTVLLEAGRADLSAKGTEINPAAVALSHIYEFINVPHKRRSFHLNAIARVLSGESLNNPPAYSESPPANHQPAEGTIKASLVNLLPCIEDRLQCRLLEALVALLDFYRPGLSLDRISATWLRLADLVIHLPYSAMPIEVYLADARETPFRSSSIDLVVTSPPYINVFNYHQQYRASMEAMSWNLLKVARSEIGSNRKHRGNRFLTVIQYCLDMAQVFAELGRVCRPASRLIFIVGKESTVRGTRFFNGEIVAEVAHEVLGFDLILRQERVFVNRYGQRIFEDILHFCPPHKGSGADLLVGAAKVAGIVLEAAYDSAPAEAKADLKFAVHHVEVVKPSPLFNLTKILVPDEDLLVTGVANA